MKKVLNWFHHFFIPREHNNFRAKAIHLHSLATYLLILIGLSFFISYNPDANNVLGYATDINVNKLLELTNAERAKQNLPPLQYNDQLAVAAQNKANDMFARDYWAHYGPDGTTPWSFILSTGYKYEYAGENLAKNFLFSDGVVQGWMNSETHRENILRPEYTEIGFAISNGVLNGEETTLVVQMFGTPLGGPAPVVAADRPAPETAGAPAQQIVQNEVPAQQSVPAQEVLQQPVVQGNQNLLAQQSSQFSWAKMFYNSKLFFLFFLFIAFALDLFVAIRMNVVQIHVGGKHMVHMLFIGFIIAGVLIVANGKIL
jgi:hypothetical protein